jgi:DDE superfamily endonuclease
LPAEADAAFVAALEDILDRYQQPPDPARPLVCFDESGKELQASRRPAVAATSGHPQRIDSEYQRHGSANCFLACAPQLGWRAVTVTAQRTKTDWAKAMQVLVDAPQFREAEKIVLVLDNLNTHTPGALYAAFPPAEAKRIRDKLEFHYTPVHGSWLNIAECELRALHGQCLHRRIPDQAMLAREVEAWVAERNAAQTGVDWQFTTTDARTKLHRLYPIPTYDN